MIGRSVSRYRIVGLLGRGGMATVWKAEDELLGRTIALKLLNDDLASSATARRRFLREARAASLLDHHGICRVYDAGEVDGQAYIALSWLDGQTISALCERAPLAVAEVMRIGVAVAEALGFAHARGVIHRDVTGRNIMVTHDDRVVVLDFGLALAVGFTRLTSSRMQVGTLPYLSPEVARGEAADARTDLYGLGVVLYEAATGSLPFVNERSEGVLYNIVHQPPEPPSCRRRDIGAALESVILRLLSKSPDGRYEQASSVVAALAAVNSDMHVAESSPSWRAVPAATTAEAGARYVAVLPFTVAEEDAAAERIFVAGLAEVLASALAAAPDVRVIPPAMVSGETSAHDLQRLARELGANLILRASARRSGLQFRVTWSLVDPARGIQIGGGTVGAESLDRFRLEDRLINAVLNALGCDAPTREAAAGHDPAARDRFILAVGYLQRHDDEALVDAALHILERLRDNEEPNGELESAYARACLYKYQLTLDPRWEGCAAGACERAAALASDAPEVLVTLGDLFLQSGQTPRAIESYERALAVDPDHPDGLIGLGRALLATGRLDVAERVHRHAVDRRPRHWGGHNALGRLLLRIGRYEEARTEFEQVVAIMPDNALGWRNLASTLFMLEQFDDALDACRRSIEIRPHARSLSTLGSILFYLGRYKEAAAAFERGVHLAPADAPMWGNLGSSCRFTPGHEQRGNEALQRAVAIGRERLDRNPADARQWAWLAEWLSNLGCYDEARAALQRALELEPANPDYMAKACAVYHESNERTLSLHWLQRALEHGFRPAQLERDPYLAGLREDPEFTRIVREFAGRHGCRPSNEEEAS
jgi:tetratricopeptide (TPR) repeat protein